MLKRITVIICTLAIIFSMNMTSFLSVKADTYTIDDLYNRLTNIYQALNGPNTNRRETTVYKINELKNLIDYMFGQTGHYDYVVNNQPVSGATFEVLMEDMMKQNNEILMSICSSYVDASDPDNVVVKPGLFAKIDNLASLLSAGNGTDIQIENDLDGIISDLSSIKSYLQTIIQLNEQSFYDLESFSAYHLFSKHNWDGTFDLTTFNYPALDLAGVSASNYNPAFDQNKRLSISPNDTVVVAFYSNTYFLQNGGVSGLNSGNNRSIYWSSMSGSTDITAELIGSETERVTYYGYLYKLFFKNESSTIQFVSFDFLLNAGTFYLIPFYVGSTRYLSDHLKSVIQYDNDILLKDLQVTNETWFERIYNQLMGNTDPNNQYDSNKESLNDSIDDYVAIESQFNTDFKNNMIDVKTEINNTGTMLQSLSMAASFVSNIIQKFYYNSNLYGYGILFLLPLILGIALFFIGRGGIVMRQGESVLEYQTVDDKPVYTPQGRKYQSHKIYRLRRKKG